MRAALLIFGLLATAGSAADRPAVVPTENHRVLPPGANRVAARLSQRTVSSSKQFYIFCPDPAARSQVASYTEEIKASVLQVLGEPDHWRYNILISLEPAPPGEGQPPASLVIFQNESGFKVEINVKLGSDPSKVNLQRVLVRAILLEFAYRDQPQLLRTGGPYLEAPWWLIEGIMQIYLRRETGLDADLFKRIVDVNRLPAIGKFLAGQPSDFEGSAVEVMDQACAMCLVQLLVDQPKGHANLASLVRHWPLGNADSVAALTTEFSTLAQNESSLQKWWTLNLARFSAADRFKGLSSQQTDTQLAAALHFEIAGPESKAPQPFELGEFANYLKLPASKEALGKCVNTLSELGTKAPDLYRPLIAEYSDIVLQLQRNKTRGLKSRITRADQLRVDLQKRMNAVTDYLNWYEATQMSQRSGKFEGYLKAANELVHPPPRQDPLSRYMDELEKAR